MKYLTKEWRQMWECAGMEIWIRAKKVEETDFARLYQKKKKQFIESEKEQLNDFKNFDEQTAERRFESLCEHRLAIVRKLPQELLDKIDDLNVVSIGYIFPALKQELHTYCRQQWREERQLAKLVVKHNAEFTNDFSNTVGLLYPTNILLKIRQRQGNICLDFRCDLCLSENWSLVIEDGEIIEQESFVYTYTEDLYASPCTQVVAVELYENQNIYEVHFLLNNINRAGQQKMWYLTISGTRLREKKKEEN